jgi:hypothetical protein
MKNESVNNSRNKKTYQKPVLQKQEMFERFTLACSGSNIKQAGVCSKAGS